MSKSVASEIPATGLPSHRRPTHPGAVLLELFLRENLARSRQAAKSPLRVDPFKRGDPRPSRLNC